MTDHLDDIVERVADCLSQKEWDLDQLAKVDPEHTVDIVGSLFERH